VGKESSSSGTGVTGFLQQEQKPILINFVMPFFGRRQAFVVVAVVTHICKLLFVDRPGEERIATASLDLSSPRIVNRTTGMFLAVLFCFSNRQCVDPCVRGISIPIRIRLGSNATAFSTPS